MARNGKRGNAHHYRHRNISPNTVEIFHLLMLHNSWLSLCSHISHERSPIRNVIFTVATRYIADAAVRHNAHNAML